MKNISYDKKYQIFVSSTYEDLKKERQALVEAILETKNIPAGMELFNASSRSQWEIIEEWIDESDIVILLVGERYGTIDNDKGKSFTHLEFDYANELKKPVLVFKFSEKYIRQRELDEEVTLTEQIEREKFKEFSELIIKDRNSSLNINSIDNLKSKVKSAIFAETKNLKGGWIREKDIQSISPIENEPNLKRKNEKDFELYTNLLPKLKELYKTNTHLTNNFNAYSQKTLNDLFQFLYQNSIHNDPSQKFIDNNLNESLNNMYDKSSNIYDIFISNKHDSINYKGVSSLELNGEKLGHPDKVQELVDSIFENYSSFKESYLNFIDYTNEKFYK